MVLRLACCVSLFLIPAANASASPDNIPLPAMYKATDADGQTQASQQLLVDRINFVLEMYVLSPEQKGKVLPLLQQLVPAQEQYEVGCSLTLHRMQLALSVIGNDPNRTPEDRDHAIAKFENQINAIQADAPLSLFGVMQKVEPLLSEQQVEAAHIRIEALIKARAKRQPPSSRPDLSEIDFLLAPKRPVGELPVMPKVDRPVEATEIATPSAAAASSAHSPPTKEIATRTPINQNKRDLAQHQPPKHQPPQAVEPAEPLEPAPPESKWSSLSEETAKKYGFNESQKQVVEKVLKSCLLRANTHRQKNDAGYKAATSLADAAAKQKNLKELNEPLDKLYYELTRRIDSLVTLEQKIAVDGPDAIPMSKPKPSKPKLSHSQSTAPRTPPVKAHDHSQHGSHPHSGIAKPKPSAAKEAKSAEK